MHAGGRAINLQLAAAAWDDADYVPHSGNSIARMRQTLLLDVCALPDFPWCLGFEDAQGERRFTQCPGRPMRDDFGLPALPRLAGFPAWLRALPAGLDFDLARAEVFGTGLRGARPKILAWRRG